MDKFEISLSTDSPLGRITQHSVVTSYRQAIRVVRDFWLNMEDDATVLEMKITKKPSFAPYHGGSDV